MDYVLEVAKLYLGEDSQLVGTLLAQRVTKRKAQQLWRSSPEAEREAIYAQVGQEGMFGSGGLFETGLKARGNGNA